MAEEVKVKTADSNVLAAISYISILSVVMYVLKKDDEFVKFHARQGMVLFVASFVWVIPVFGWMIGMVAFLAAVVGAVKAYSGEKFKLPVVGDLAEKIDF